MSVFAIGVEHALVVSVQRFHDGAQIPLSLGAQNGGALLLRHVAFDQGLEIALSNCDPDRSRHPPDDGLRELPPDFELHHVFGIDF